MVTTSTAPKRAPRQQLNAVVPPEMYQQVKAMARAEDRTVSGIVRNALRMYLSYQTSRD